ncbi:MAG TPA: non-homologous end-joining DNA ligase [Vicinamibacteria bacterium]|nr:non-homologous end-joining DNA ligase [Vicinamibacteria bacterium]
MATRPRTAAAKSKAKAPKAAKAPKSPGRPTRNHHPARRTTAPSAPALPPGVELTLPRDVDNVEVRLGPRAVRLTNLRKPFWPDLGITKGDLLQYYADVSPYLLPHLRDRAMVMKRYPHGAAGEFFFMKRAPTPRPDWIELCSIEHESGNVIDFPMIQDLPALLWVINLGCIDLNQWYARCDDVDRPDYVHFDLDPVKGKAPVPFERVLETAQLVHRGLEGLGMPSFAKTTGSRGIHVYVPIVRGPTQKDVWGFANRFALGLAALRPDLITAEYVIAKRPEGRILVDYNQNAWGHTLASIYSVRPHPQAAVSTPVSWDEVDAGLTIEQFTLRNVPERLRTKGDLWAPVLADRPRFRLEKYL